jgi:hypothetical protein
MPRLKPTIRNLLLIASGALGLAAVLVLAFVLLSQPPVPKAVLRQAPYAVYYAKANPDITVDKSSYKYDSGNKQTSFVLQYKGKHLVFSEQPSPDQMQDIPEYYPKFIDQLSGYASFESGFGRVDLTRPGGKTQVAVINAKGALSFVRTDGDLSVDDWRRLFNNLAVTTANR